MGISCKSPLRLLENIDILLQGFGLKSRINACWTVFFVMEDGKMVIMFLASATGGLLGTFMVIVTRKETEKRERKSGMQMGICMLAAGTGMLGGLVSYYIIGKGLGVAIAIPMVLFGISSLYAVGADVYGVFSCTEQVRAKCMKVKEKHSNNGVGEYESANYVPEFSYEWEGKKYQINGSMLLTKRKAKHYVPGRKYILYVNPRKPWIAREHRWLEWIDFVMIPFGIFWILVGVSMIMTMDMQIKL